MNSWDPPPIDVVLPPGFGFRVGARVRLRPTRGADILDQVLNGMTASIAAIEQDYEGRVYLAVVIDEDPGKDLGLEGKPGHRFFFRPEEVESLDAQEKRL